MTLDFEKLFQMQERLDQLATELLARANALDGLALLIESRERALLARESMIAQRERDVLLASAELSTLRKKVKRGEIDYGRSAQ